jgi:hypothetical protein
MLHLLLSAYRWKNQSSHKNDESPYEPTHAMVHLLHP